MSPTPPLPPAHGPAAASRPLVCPLPRFSLPNLASLPAELLHAIGSCVLRNEYYNGPRDLQSLTNLRRSCRRLSSILASLLADHHLLAAARQPGPQDSTLTLKHWLSYGASANAFDIVTDEQPLHAAVVWHTRGRLDAHDSSHLSAIQLLLSHGASVRSFRIPRSLCREDRMCQCEGWLLYHAVDNDHVDIAKLLLEHGEQVDSAGHDPIIHQAKSPSMARLLLEHGADVNAMRISEVMASCGRYLDWHYGPRATRLSVVTDSRFWFYTDRPGVWPEHVRQELIAVLLSFGGICKVDPPEPENWVLTRPFGL